MSHLKSQPPSTVVAEWEADELAERYQQDFELDIRPYLTEDTIRLLRDERLGVLRFSGCRPGDAAFYEAVARKKYYYMDDKWEFQAALRAIGSSDTPEDSSILEVGCGAGAFLDQCLASGLNGCEGLEISPTAIESCHSRGLRVSDTSLESLAVQGRRFDVVCAFQVLEHVPDPEQFLRAASAVLSDDGQLILSTPNAESFLRRFRWCLLDLPPHHLSRWDATAYQRTAEELGLFISEIRYEPLAKYHRKMYAASFWDRYPRKTVRRVATKVAAKVAFGLHPLKRTIRGHSIMVRMSRASTVQQPLVSAA
ncbi:MAG: class I SAM-dependent methyltransferase [Planctomycetota bacterium]